MDRLTDGLRAAWEAVAALPDDDAAFDALDPDARRRAHDLGVRAQDRLVRCLARLVEGMARDGADLLDERGLPPGYRGAPSGPGSDQVT
jgi:hypothetical protein